MRVAVAAVDIDTRELDFRLVARAGGPKKARIKTGAKSRGKRGTKTAKPAGGRKKKIRPGKNERRAETRQLIIPAAVAAGGVRHCPCVIFVTSSRSMIASSITARC